MQTGLGSLFDIDRLNAMMYQLTVNLGKRRFVFVSESPYRRFRTLTALISKSGRRPATFKATLFF